MIFSETTERKEQNRLKEGYCVINIECALLLNITKHFLSKFK